MNSKAQVALEYLLIIVVSLTIIISAFMLMQMRAGTTVEVAGERTDTVLCDIQDCEEDSDCQDDDNCGTSATCGPDQTCIP